VVTRAPTWTRDELILALDLYSRAGKARQHDPKIIALSKLLRSARGGNPSDPSLRSPASVHLKLQNFLRLDPSYRGAGMAAGSHLEAEVWADFHHHPRRLHSVANGIRELIMSSAGEDEDEIEAPEGRLLVRYHRSRERARELVARKKERALRIGEALICEVCAFDFAARYGIRGFGFIECHHKQPLSSLSPGAKTKLADLALVCSNCHSMLHRGDPWPSVDELRRSLGRSSFP
jgi:5-methylcytosine-specific restriction protein A